MARRDRRGPRRHEQGPFRARPDDGSAPPIEAEAPLVLGCPWPAPASPPREARRRGGRDVLEGIAIAAGAVGCAALIWITMAVALVGSCLSTMLSHGGVTP